MVSWWGWVPKLLLFPQQLQCTMQNDVLAEFRHTHMQISGSLDPLPDKEFEFGTFAWA